MSLLKDSHQWLESVEADPIAPLPDLTGDAEVENSLFRLHAQTRQDIEKNEEQRESMSEEKFLERVRKLLEGQNNPHLKFGLEVLAALSTGHPGSLIGNEIDEFDGPQQIIDILSNYIEEHLEDLLDALEGSDTSVDHDLKNFVTTEKHSHANKSQLMIMYLTQLAHVAFHIVYYGYTPVEKVDLPNWAGAQSALIMTYYGSILTATPTIGGLEAEYHRLSIRDEEECPKPLSIAKGAIQELRTQRYAGVNLGHHVLRAKTKCYKSFSANIILAIKEGQITERESTCMLDSQVSVSRIIRFEDIKAALLNRDGQ